MKPLRAGAGRFLGLVVSTLPTRNRLAGVVIADRDPYYSDRQAVTG